MCRQFEYLILTIAMTCTLAGGQQRPTGTAPGSTQAQQATLTDRDVIQMGESGKPEAAIVTSIRSRRTNFDLSPQGCRSLAAAHVSRTILNAMGNGSQTPCVSTSESSKPQTSGAGARLGNGNATLLGDGSKQTQLTAAAPSGGGDRVALNPQPLPPRTAANPSSGIPGANVAQASTAVSDYRQPSGNKVPSGSNGVPSGRVLLPPDYRPAKPQHPAGSVSAKMIAPVGMVKAQPAGSAPLGPGHTFSAQNPSTSPTNSSNSIAPAATNVRTAIAAKAHYPGTVEGYVYWDSNWDGGYCGYITVTVSVAQRPSVYTSLGALSNISEYVGTVKYEETGVVGSVTVCKYTYTNVPLGQDLQVHLDLGPIFSLSVRPFNPTVGPIKIPKISSIKCRMSSPDVVLANPSLSQADLNSPWEACGSSADKVNFGNAVAPWL